MLGFGACRAILGYGHDRGMEKIIGFWVRGLGFEV